MIDVSMTEMWLYYEGRRRFEIDGGAGLDTVRVSLPETSYIFGRSRNATITLSRIADISLSNVEYIEFRTGQNKYKVILTTQSKKGWFRRQVRPMKRI